MAKRWEVGRSGSKFDRGLFGNKYLQESVFAEHRLRPFDIALVFCSSMFPYVDHAEFSTVRKVVDLVDVDSMKWEQLSKESAHVKRPIYKLEAARVKRLEQRIADQVSAVVLVSEKEAAQFRSRVTTETPIIGVSNGVDTEYFQPSKAISGSIDPVRDSHPTACHLVFTGVLDYTPNVEGLKWFCNCILPKLREQSEFVLNVVGRRANATVERLASIDGVNLIGEVPDVRPYLLNADIAVSPLKLARGIQNKVLEAMACGLTVVTTPQSAEGIDAVDGEEFVIADEESQWIQTLVRLSVDSNRCRSIGEAARQRVVDHYSWNARLSKLTELCSRCVTGLG